MSTTHASTTKGTVKLKKPALGKSKSTQNKPTRSATGKFVTPEQRQLMIAEAAYFMAEKRGFTEGDQEADWLCAETQIDKMLTTQ